MNSIFRKLFPSKNNKYIKLDLENHLCFYTRNHGKELLIQYTNISQDNIDIILQYTDNYREDGRKNECIYKLKYKFVIYYMIQHVIYRINLVTVVKGKNEIENNILAIYTLLQLEMSFKKLKFLGSKYKCSILMLTNSMDQFVKDYQKRKYNLKEAWMLKDIFIQSKDELITSNNNFKICFNLDICKPTDEFSIVIINTVLYNTLKLSEKLENIIKSAKNIILLDSESKPIRLDLFDQFQTQIHYLYLNINTTVSSYSDLKAYEVITPSNISSYTNLDTYKVECILTPSLINYSI